MTVSSFCYSKAVYAVWAWVFSRCKSKIGCILVSFCKSFEISGFNNQRQCGMRLDSKKAFQFLDFVVILCLLRDFLDPFIISLNLGFLFFVWSEIMGYLKGKSSLMIFEKHANLKYKYGNRHFWCRGDYVDTVGKNAKNTGIYSKSAEKWFI